MNTRMSWDDYFIQIAWMAASRATCPRLSVGCVIVDTDHRIVSTGYNGSAPGAEHCIDVGCDDATGHCLRTIHAEANAIAYASRKRRKGATLYCTHVPCSKCSALILRSGIIRVVYDEPYESAMKNVDLLVSEGIVVEEWPSIPDTRVSLVN